MWILLLASLAFGADLAPKRGLWPEPDPSRRELVGLDPPRVAGADTIIDEAELNGDFVVSTKRVVPTPCRPLLDQRLARSIPARSSAELLRIVPGVVQTTRLGLGGALQTAWRGYANGYGADLAVDLEGVPLNEPGHAFTPGYLDLWALPTTLVSSVDLCAGAARPDRGAFGVAGSAHFELGRPSPGWWVKIGGGTDGSGSLALRWSPRHTSTDTFVHADVDGGQGVGSDRTWRQLRFAAGLGGDIGAVHITGFLLAYDGLNDTPSLIDEHDLAIGRVRYYGGYRDGTGDLRSRRLLLGARATRLWDWGGLQAVVWAGLRGWRLRDNPTGFLHDPVSGDAFATRQASQDLGIKLKLHRTWQVLGSETHLEGGVMIRSVLSRERHDDLDFNAEITRTTSDLRYGTLALAAWTRASIGFGNIIRVVPGLRIEQTEIRRSLTALGPASADRAGVFLPLPSVALESSPIPEISLSASWGRAFRPPDPHRFAVSSKPQAWLFDVLDTRAELRPTQWLALSLDGFASWSKQERILDPLYGATLFTAPTRRAGGTLAIELAPQGLPNNVPLVFRANVTGADARRTDTNALLPYAPRWTGQVGATFQRWPLRPAGVRALFLTLGVQLVWTGRRPLPGGFMQRGMANTDIVASVDWKRWTFSAAIDNAIPWRWRQAEFMFASQWSQTEPTASLPTRHFVAGNPFALRLSASWRF